MTYFRPKTLKRACALLAKEGARVVAGGTDLVVRMERGLEEPESFIDISYLPLRHVEREGDKLVLGALVEMSTLAAHPQVQSAAPLLAMAARDVAAPQLRNRATIGGNIVNASPAADGVCALSVYNPVFTLLSQRGERQVPFADFFTGPGRTVMGADELLTAVTLDTAKPPGTVTELAHWFKHGNRLAQVISVVAFAGRTFLDAEGAVVEARFSVASVAPVPYRIQSAEEAAQGKKLTPEVIHSLRERCEQGVKPIDDLRASANYRKSIVGIFIQRHLTDFADGRPHFGSDQPPSPLPLREFGEEGEIAFVLNGERVVYAGEMSVRLLDMLRDHFGLTGTKNGCGEGECGACTVFMNGLPVNACMVLAGNADGKIIQTVEGLTAPDGSAGLIQQAFVDAGAVQCGFCIPGLEVSAQHYMETHDHADRQEIRKAISGNLCRCTGYVKIVDAVELAMARKGETHEM